MLIGLMLGYPLLDPHWRPPSWPRAVAPAQFPSQWITNPSTIFTLVVGVLIVALLVWRPRSVTLFLSTVLFAALPEEWFFRGYFMSRIGSGWRANLIASILFAVLHGFTQDWRTAVLVFGPSLFYGWLYQRTRDLPLVVLTHALSNLIYLLGFGVWLYRWKM